MWNRIKNFLSGARYELKNVSWPTKNRAIRLTLIVILASVVLAIFLGAFDILFTYILKTFILN